MDQPEMLGDSAFRDAGTSLRREGQSFRQIVEALEINAATGTRNEDITSKGELLQPPQMDGEPRRVPRWREALAFGTRIFFYPLRHPIRTLVIALILFMLVNTFRGFVGVGRQVSGYVAVVSAARQRADAAASSVSAFFQNLTRPFQHAAPSPTSPAPTEASPAATPSAGPTVASAPPTATPTPQASPASPSANEAAAPSTSPAPPPATTPRPDMRSSPPSTVASNNRLRAVEPRAFEDLMPTEIRRHSRSGGPCTSGIGGCYWGGTRY
jgi:hypothetical protein